ncbi:hypothetical protein [Microbacterium sp. 18062]|uniref:hypothetical protein n=1 Tax=Microbacterium sp. 18062 TaxID=2681410 RepID=UPI001358D067|nr:hypothetical protein [Microbacterium sp. 18062]
MRPWLTWTIGAGALMAAWLVALATPSQDDVESPFAVRLELGQAAAGRNLEVTVIDVRMAREVAAGAWSAEGTWLVVDLDAQAVVAEDDALLTAATLEVGGTTYRASERPASLLGAALSVGIPRTGGLAFELPGDPPTGTATLSLGLDADTRLDSLLELPIALDAVPRVARADLVPTGWAAP